VVRISYEAFTSQVCQEIDGAALGGADVGGSDEAQGPAAVEVGAQRTFEDSEAVPLDEGAEQIDAIGRGNLGLEDLAEAGLAAGIDEEIADAEENGSLWQVRGAEANVFDEAVRRAAGSRNWSSPSNPVLTR
jgi:hypothetical protein